MLNRDWIQVSLSGGTEDDMTTCLSESDCLLQYNFAYDDNWNDCHGNQYVKKYEIHFVGIVLCNQNRWLN